EEADAVGGEATATETATETAAETAAAEALVAEAAEPKPAKVIVFDVTCHDVKGKELPALDDAFASTVGSFTDLEELRSEIRKELEQREESGARAKLEDEVLEEVLGQATVPIPQKL